MSTIEELEARLAAIEERMPAVRAATPPITIGELTDVPTPGAAIASPWAQEVTHRIVQRFATTTALTGWAAQRGALAQVNSSDNTQGLYERGPSGWRRPWSIPSGPIAVASTGTAQSSIGTSNTALTGLQVSVGVLAGRKYRLDWLVSYFANASLFVDTKLMDVTTGTQLNKQSLALTANWVGSVTGFHYVDIAADGAKTYRLDCQTNASTVNTLAAGNAPCFLAITDCGMT